MADAKYDRNLEENVYFVSAERMNCSSILEHTRDVLDTYLDTSKNSDKAASTATVQSRALLQANSHLLPFQAGFFERLVTWKGSSSEQSTLLS